MSYMILQSRRSMQSKCGSWGGKEAQRQRNRDYCLEASFYEGRSLRPHPGIFRVTLSSAQKSLLACSADHIGCYARQMSLETPFYLQSYPTHQTSCSLSIGWKISLIFTNQLNSSGLPPSLPHCLSCIAGLKPFFFRPSSPSHLQQKHTFIKASSPCSHFIEVKCNSMMPLSHLLFMTGFSWTPLHFRILHFSNLHCIAHQ